MAAEGGEGGGVGGAEATTVPQGPNHPWRGSVFKKLSGFLESENFWRSWLLGGGSSVDCTT